MIKVHIRQTASSWRLYSHSIFAKVYFYLCAVVSSHRPRLCGLLACKCTNSQRLMSMYCMHDYCRVEESFCFSLFRVFSRRRDRDACHHNQNQNNSFCSLQIIPARLGRRCLSAFLNILNFNAFVFAMNWSMLDSIPFWCLLQHIELEYVSL